jgi:hypothetical protein
MAIAFGAVSTVATASGTSLTYSHTVTGSNNIILVGVWIVNTDTDTVTGVTYNGVAMTRMNTITCTVPSSQRGYLYYLLSPSTGANNVVVSSSSADIQSRAISYTGVTSVGANGTFTPNASTTTAAISVTTTANNSWLVAGARNFAAAVTAGSGTTMRSSAVDDFGDSTNIATSGTNYTLNFASSSSGWLVNAIELQEGSTPTAVLARKALLGVGN